MSGAPRRPRPALGIALVFAMGACFAVSDTTIKYLGGLLPVLFLLWMRYAFQAGAMALWLGRQGRGAFRTVHPKFQWARGALLLATSALSFYGLQFMPVAEFTALGMLSPVIVTLIAATVLRENVSPLRWVLVWGGFLGAVIVIRPGGGVFGWEAVFPLLMALAYGSFQVLTSRLARLESPYVTHFYTGFSGAVLLVPVLAFAAPQMLATLRAAEPLHWALIALIGAAATSGHLFLIFAFQHAPTSTLMPFIYTQIGFALLTSYAVFRHVPDGWAWFGMGVIAACGAASAWLNVRAAASRPVPDSVVSADTLGD